MTSFLSSRDPIAFFHLLYNSWYRGLNLSSEFESFRSIQILGILFVQNLFLIPKKTDKMRFLLMLSSSKLELCFNDSKMNLVVSTVNFTSLWLNARSPKNEIKTLKKKTALFSANKGRDESLICWPLKPQKSVLLLHPQCNSHLKHKT